MDSQTVTDKLTKTSAKTETSGYDDYGNPSTQKTTRGGLTETQTFHYVQKGSWCLNKPDSIKTVRTISGDSQTRIVAFEYDNKGNLTKEIIHPADTNKVVTEYKNFDGFGNPRTVEVTANNKKRSSSMTYTSSGRFVKTKTNVLGETTTYDWDETKSRLNYESDYQSRKTSYQYDNWGRLVLTTYPDGIRSAQVLQWAGNKSGKPDGAKYYSYSETSGAPPVIAWYDGLGRELRTESYGLNRKTIWADTEYNSKGQVQTAWEPYFSNEAKTNKTTYKYDRYGRDSVIVTPVGTTSYVYSDTTVTVTTPTDVVQTKTNAAGWTVSQKTNGKTVTFTHYASGQVKTATPDGGTAVSMEYDLQGNRTKLIDPDAGTILSAYNGFGELLWTNEKVHTTGDSIITSYDYLASGLLNYKLRSTEKTNYRYDNKNRLSSISISGKHAQGFTYDKYDRIIQANDTVDGSKIFVRQTEYDALGRIKKEIYPGGYYATNEYETYGYLKKVTDSKGSLIWEAQESNARGQLTKTKSGNRETIFGFDSRGLPTSILTSGIINQAYLFNSQGNLSSREDKLTGYKETFEYNSNRLSGWSTWKDGLVLDYKTIDYNSTTGNMNSKSGLSNMKYGENSKPPHALTSFNTSSTDFNNSQAVQYTDFRKVKKITEWGDILNIYYGVDEQRIKSDWVRSTGGTQVKYYMGNYEEENNSGVIRKIHYICGGNGLAAVYVQNGNNDTLYYAHTDYLGSLTALSLPNGTVVERYAYDPWGNRRNPNNWTQTDTRTKFILDRGYTMHEHLTAFKLINMNGRVYDPVTAQFLSTDPYIQAPGNWLNYNRYAYCLNNPLKYTDPTGEFFYIIPFFGYSLDGGWEFSLTIGFGVPGGFGGQVSFGYGANSGFTATAGGSFGGAYAYAGYNSQAGFIAGAGYGLGSLGNIGIVNISSNINSCGLNYSQKGGLSASAFGLQYSKQGGLTVNPSIGVSVTYGKGIYSISDLEDNNFGVVEADKSTMTTNEQLYQMLGDKNVDLDYYNVGFVDIEKENIAQRNGYEYFRRNGVIYKRYPNGDVYLIAGTTAQRLDSFRAICDIYMSTHNSTENFLKTLNHEFIHSWQWRWGSTNRREYSAYTEASASTYTQQYYPSINVPVYIGWRHLYDWPKFVPIN